MSTSDLGNEEPADTYHEAVGAIRQDLIGRFVESAEKAAAGGLIRELDERESPIQRTLVDIAYDDLNQEERLAGWTEVDPKAEALDQKRKQIRHGMRVKQQGIQPSGMYGSVDLHEKVASTKVAVEWDDGVRTIELIDNLEILQIPGNGDLSGYPAPALNKERIIGLTDQLVRAVVPDEGVRREDIMGLEIDGDTAVVRLRAGHGQVAHTVNWKALAR